MKVLVTGANGQLGSELKRIATDYPKDQYTFVDIEEMDLGTDETIQSYFQDRTFDYVINCAAYTAVDKAEEESAIAFRVNAEAVRAIANACKDKKIRLIHISTDYVFNGEGNLPITEDRATSPLSVYGKSKLAGEEYARSILSNCYIVRTAWVYSTFGKNFVKTIAKYSREKESLNVIFDQVGSPTYARDLADTICKMIQKIHSGEVDKPGTYHYSNEGVISWYDFAWFIVNYYGVRCHINPIRTEEYKTLAIRPRFSVLDKRLISKTFGIEVPHWHSSLMDCLKDLKL